MHYSGMCKKRKLLLLLKCRQNKKKKRNHTKIRCKIKSFDERNFFFFKSPALQTILVELIKSSNVCNITGKKKKKKKWTWGTSYRTIKKAGLGARVALFISPRKPFINLSSDDAGNFVTIVSTNCWYSTTIYVYIYIYIYLKISAFFFALAKTLRLKWNDVRQLWFT